MISTSAHSIPHTRLIRVAKNMDSVELRLPNGELGLSAEEICRRIAISRRTLSRWIAAGITPKPRLVFGCLVWAQSDLPIFAGIVARKKGRSSGKMTGKDKIECDTDQVCAALDGSIGHYPPTTQFQALLFD